jgi:hypothetical protein
MLKLPDFAAFRRLAAVAGEETGTSSMMSER